MTAADLIRDGKLRRAEFAACMDPDLVDEHERLTAERAEELARAADSFAGGSRAPEIQAQIDGLLEEMEAATVTLVLQALPRRRYRALIDQHPPRKDADGVVVPRDARLGVHYDDFFAALVRASIVEPDLDAETVDLLLDERLSDGQWERLTTIAWNLNRASVDVPFSPAGSASRRRSSAR